jgi:hypothetical protein
MTIRFPRRVYTAKEVERARRFVESGRRHKLVVKGSLGFKRMSSEALKHIKTAGFHDFLRSYIKQIVEIDGFSQLREEEAAVWANMQLLNSPIEAAGFFVQKAWLMKEFLEGKPYYGGLAEARSVEKRIGFLKSLKANSRDHGVQDECERILRSWDESTFVF